jgi:hypothetical protein
MRTLAIVCAVIAAVLSALAALWTTQVIHAQTDREAMLGVAGLVFIATPFALVAATLSLRNLRTWPALQIVGSLGAVVFVVLVGLWSMTVA